MVVVVVLLIKLIVLMVGALGICENDGDGGGGIDDDGS